MKDDVNEPLQQDKINGPFGPPPEEYLYRCTSCGSEGLINEEIIDVTVGTLKFYGRYQGGMPLLICPHCEQETWQYVKLVEPVEDG